MRRVVAFSVVLGMVLAVVIGGPVSAKSRQAVTITVTTTFDEFPDEFTATGIPDCEWGLVYDAGGHVQFAPPLGVFAGYKAFDCEGGGENGFLVRVNARFGEGGSFGRWAVLDSWGSLAGMTGAGGLTGEPIDGGIIDHYVGAIVR